MRAGTAGAVGVLLGLLLTGCAGTSPADREEGALAAARAYVDAIAHRDPDAADAMTDPEAVEERFGSDRETDIRAALADAVDPIADPWVSLATATQDEDDREYELDVSWTIRGVVGGGVLRIRLEDGGDPAGVDDWLVTGPLLEGGDVYVPARRSRIGPTELEPSDGLASVAGYPGGYLAEPVVPSDDADPRPVVLGAPEAG